MATYLVTQATGQQSQAVIAHLLAAGFKIHAVVRDLQKVPATLHHKDITIFQGTSDNLESIVAAAKGCKGAFLNTFPIPGLETKQAETVVEACKQVGVESLVASTTFCTGDQAIWDDDATKAAGLHEYYTSKASIEKAVRAGGFKSYTIVRPAFIHFDYFLPASKYNFPRLASHGIMDHAYESGVKMPQTDAQDVGRYVAAALKDPEAFNGLEIELSAELLTIDEAHDVLAKVSGRDIQLVKSSGTEGDMLLKMAQKFHVWANAKDLQAAMVGKAEVHAKLGMPLTTLKVAMQRDKARLLESLP